MGYWLRTQKANWTRDWVQGIAEQPMMENVDYPPSPQSETEVDQEIAVPDSVDPSTSVSSFQRTTTTDSESASPELSATPGHQNVCARKLDRALNKLSRLCDWIRARTK
ncbi:hypothetical protein N7452_002846 [Penicillium brevicompactum]|uniref:Uncharacterized protein n=1 Tax=Penicillium brevicompactum TaxID=5074 RepID=A0A9W9UJF5_PENBR|nr:hypothetical protein N7452_002846 [Penicillium brevicompactum]